MGFVLFYLFKFSLKGFFFFFNECVFPVVSFLHVDLVPAVGMTAILMSAAGLPVHLTCVPQAASTHKATKKHSSVKEGRKVSKKGSSCSNSDICFHLLLYLSALVLPPSFPLVSPPTLLALLI